MKEVKFSYRAHPKQAIVHSNPSRFRVLVAGRRFGKTLVAVSEVCFHALTVPKSRLWYISPTYRQSKTVAWRVFLDLLPPETIVKKNEQDLEIILANGSEISLKGTERADTLRGVGLDGVVMDEVAFMKKDIWETIIRPMLIDRNGWALFIGTPNGYGYFWKLAKLGDHANEIEGDAIEILGEEGKKLEPDKDWQTFRYTTYDNPYIPTNEVSSAKETMNEDYFSQEYLARFTRFTGLVYGEFDPSVHIISPFDIPLNWVRGIGTDVGYTNPSASEFLAVNENGDLYVYDELYVDQTTSSEYIDMLRIRMQDKYLQIKVADPSAADFIARAREAGIWYTSPRKPEGTRQSGWVGETINWVKDYLKIQQGTGKPKLYIFNHCKNLIREFQTYVWDEKKWVSDDRKPKKENDHALDALRYVIMALRGKKSEYSNYDVYGERIATPTGRENVEWDISKT